MNCTECKFRKENCIKDCLQIYFKSNLQNLRPIKIHKLEVNRVEIDSGFLIITDTDGIQHGYNCDTISSFHVPGINRALQNVNN